MSFTLYPDPPVRALSVPAGATVFSPFAARSARVAAFDPPYPQLMFVTVAMLGGSAVPGLILAAGAGAPVEVSVDPQGVFRSPGAAGYVGDVWLHSVGPNVFRVLVGLVAPDAGLTWRLGIRNTDTADRYFTWVVADSEADAAQSWVDPGPVDYQVVTTIPVGPARRLALDAARRRVYATTIGSGVDGAVTMIDLDGRTVLGSVPVGRLPFDVVVDPQSHTVFSSSSLGSTLAAINPATQQVTPIELPGGGVSGLLVDAATRTLYASVASPSGALLMVDLDTHTLTKTISLGTNNAPRDLALDPVNHTVFATDYNTPQVMAIDPQTEAVTHIALQKPVMGIAVDATSHAVYVSGCPTDNAVTVIDPATQATSTITVGTQPTGMTADTGAHTVYVANYIGGSISAIDTRTGTVVNVPLGQYESPQPVVADPVTHTVVTATTSSTLSVIERHR